MHSNDTNTERPQRDFSKALDAIQAAQYHVSDACAALSTINGMCDEWEDICQLHDHIKEKWYILESSRGKILPDEHE